MAMSSSLKMSSMSSIIGFLDFFTQSCVQINASTIGGDKFVRYGSSTRPLVLNAYSDATVEICIAKISKKNTNFYKPLFSKT